MTRFIIKVFRLLYSITKLKLLSFIAALLFISVLNVITVYGLCMLLIDLVPTFYLLSAFRFPFVIPTIFAFVAINFFMLPRFGSVSSDYRKGENYTTLLLYIAITLILLAYTVLGADTQ
jgi:hypothetical protein